MKKLLICIIPFATSLILFAEDAKFTALFNGKDLTGWTGEGYVVKDGAIMATPKAKNLITTKMYTNYVLEFEFLLTPGANNGLGINYPGTGDSAYTGLEIQILDDTDPKYKDLLPTQFHGSIYKMAAAEKGHLKPVGEWNKERVTVTGSKVTVELNGVLIVTADLDKAAAEHPDHQGVKRRTGYIGFLGHGDQVSFKNIAIKEMP